MRVQVDLRGDLASRVSSGPPGGRGFIELPANASVDGLAAALGLPSALAVFVVNGTAVTAPQPLREGDRVQVFPVSAGG